MGARNSSGVKPRTRAKEARQGYVSVIARYIEMSQHLDQGIARVLGLRFCITAFLALCLGIGSMASENDFSISIAPPNPAYVKWVSEHTESAPRKAKRLLGTSDTVASGVNLVKYAVQGGLMPTKTDFSYLTNGTRRLLVRGGNDLPNKYDPRGSYTTPVRHQDPNNQGLGTCWAQATVGSMESWLKKHDIDVQFSVRNMVNHSGRFVPKKVEDWKQSAWSGANFAVSSAYLLRWNGPVLEAEDPYVDVQTGLVRLNFTSPTLPAWGHLQRTCIIPVRKSATDNDTLKRAIVEFGGLWVSMLLCECNEETKNLIWNESHPGAFYYPKPDNPCHAVTVVGWDDNYPKENFGDTSKVGYAKPAGNGAFIVKDSYGNDRGRDNGYIYWRFPKIFSAGEALRKPARF